MKYTPLPFTRAMAEASRREVGPKTQTRRIVKVQPQRRGYSTIYPNA